MVRVFVDGEAGTTGLLIREKLECLPEVQLLTLPLDLRKNIAAKREIFAQADFVIICLPDEAAKDSAALASSLGDKAPRIIDASSAHRVAPGWVYGLPELSHTQRERIRTASRVSNPGCHATGAIVLLHPLVQADVLPADYPVTISSVSGYSGGGKAMIEAHESGQAPAFEHYALGLQHKHLPEICAYSGLSRPPLFMPSVGSFRQGMLVSIPLFLDTLPKRPSFSDVRDIFHNHYDEGGYIRVASQDAPERLEATSLSNTNVLEIYVVGNVARHQAVLIAKFDNLGKGASGAAVQNLQLMLS